MHIRDAGCMSTDIPEDLFFKKSSTTGKANFYILMRFLTNAQVLSTPKQTATVTFVTS